MKFKQVIGVDLVDMKFNDAQVILLNVVCWGTGSQQAEVLPSKESKAVTQAFAKIWKQHYGVPDLIVGDQGGEFTGDPWCQFSADNGIVLHFIDSGTPWQQGRTERAGGLLKEQLQTAIREASVTTSQEFALAVSEAVDARN